MCVGGVLRRLLLLLVAACLQFSRCILAGGASGVSYDEASTCFPPGFPFFYKDCCREVVSDTGKTFMHDACFDDTLTWERCCTFKFGPKLRGLPQRCASVVEDNDGAVTLDIGTVGPVKVFCHEHMLWMNAYYTARLLADLEAVMLGAKRTWPEGYRTLREFQGKKLHVLNVGCGMGLLEVTLAKLGHTFTAVDSELTSLAFARHNLAYNGLQVPSKAFVQWDMRHPPSADLLQQGPWDLAFSEVTSPLIYTLWKQQDQELGVSARALAATAATLMHTLFGLPAKRFVFIGSYDTKLHHSNRLHFATSTLMSGLAHTGERPEHRQPCRQNQTAPEDGLCNRRPIMSPKFWVPRLGLGPPTCHSGYVIW
eukprot:TRINITY_DN76161_c0_g1_i1.p1 TRINITY_DN76161_c0_g1~~TRINITY_DN76161_c0_g1_i1.p1  ORF type:complete len:368 (-),score=39.33 TRINITY_DN76161_c0_g1_i1:415-1518(-)